MISSHRPAVESLKPPRALPPPVPPPPEPMEARLSRLPRPDGPVRHVEVLASVDSTNRRVLDDGRQGLLLVAMEQTMGRGRHGNAWSSPPGGLYMSYAPPGDLMPPRPTDLSILASLAVASAVERALERAGAGGVRALLKWPNDVLVGDGKVAGVLVQSRGPPAPVVGVGINVNTPVDLEEDRPVEEWPVGPMALCQVAGGPLDLVDLAGDLAGELTRRVATGLDPGAVEEYRGRCHTLGRRVAFSDGTSRTTGTATGIDPEDGALMVRLGDGTLRRVTSGEVRHVRSVRG